jgi:hypothetical protein
VDAFGPPIDLAVARRRLVSRRRRQREFGGIAAALSAAGALACAGGQSSVGWPLLLGAAAAALGAAWVWGERGALLTRLVAQGDALTLPAVRAYAERLLRRRQTIAAGLRYALDSCAWPTSEFALVRPERVDEHTERLARLAEAFADPAVPIDPSSAALCVRMLREPVVSPLYNVRRSPAELDRLLTAIERGVLAG